MKKITRNVVFASVLIGLMFMSLITINAQTNQKTFIEGTLYLKIKNNSSLSVSNFQGKINPNDVYFLDGLVNKYQIKSVELPFLFSKSDLLQRTLKVKFENIEETNSFLKELKKISELEYVEQAAIYKTASVEDPDDEYYNKIVEGMSGINQLGSCNSSWHLEKIHAAEAWAINSGSPNIIVAVLDNAIWTSHPDLAGKIDSEYDLSDWPTINNDANPPIDIDNAGRYTWSHGTHIAGIIAGSTDNSEGIASIGNQIKIMAIKLSDTLGSGLEILNLPEAIMFAADSGANVINISSFSLTWSQTLLNACNYAYNKGCVIVAAAGNDASTAKYYPAAFENVISVGSTDYNDHISSFSNYGQYVDVYAPGGYATTGFSNVLRYSILSSTYNTCGILSDLFDGASGGAACYSIESVPITGNYDFMFGTSQAAAIVSGVCALVISENAKLSATQIKQIIINSADNITEGGRVNAYEALIMAEDTVISYDMPYANFQASATSINLNDTVTFTNSSIGEYDLIEWTFEGGMPYKSTSVNPSVIYNVRGNFDASLKLTLIDRDTTFIYDTLVVRDSAWYKDTLWGKNPTTGELMITGYENKIKTNVHGDTCYKMPSGKILCDHWYHGYYIDTLTKIDTTFAIKQQIQEIKRKLILVGEQVEDMSSITISALREQLLNIGNGYSVLKIVPINKDTVWALSYDNTNYTLTLTYDYGLHWTEVSLASMNLDTVYDFSASSADNIWLLALKDGETNKGVFVSNDGGSTWNIQTTAFDGFIGNLRKITMINDNTGICVGEEDSGENIIMYKTTDGGTTWTSVTNACFKRKTNEYVSTNIFSINNVLAFGTSCGRIIKTENMGTAWAATTPAGLDSTYCITSLTYASVKRTNTSTILQGLLIAKNTIGTKLMKSTDGTAWANVTVSNTNGLIKDAYITPMDATIAPNSSNNANEFVIIVEDTLATHPYNMKSMYSRNGGTAWTIVDTNINYTTIALYDYHRGWFGGVTSNFSGGIYKWFDVPTITFNPIEIIEGDTVGIIPSDFFQKPKQHLYIYSQDPDGRQTKLTSKNLTLFFLFYYPEPDVYDVAEIKGASIMITGRERDVYSYTAEANNGLRYTTYTNQAVIVNSTKHKFVFVTATGDTILRDPVKKIKIVDTNVCVNEYFEYTVITKDQDVDALHSKSGLGDIFTFIASLPAISASQSWLYFEDNKDTTSFRKTATVSGLKSKPTGANKDIVTIFVNDGTFRDTLYIYITVNAGGACSTNIETNTLDNEITLYPNPASTLIYVKNAEGLKYEMMDISGRLIKSDLIQKAEENISIDNIPNGSYFIKFIGSDKIITKKIIKL